MTEWYEAYADDLRQEARDCMIGAVAHKDELERIFRKAARVVDELTARLEGGKYVGNEAAVQIAEEAFRAGFRACVGRPLATMDDDPKAEDDAWSAFEPSEACKDLTR